MTSVGGATAAPPRRRIRPALGMADAAFVLLLVGTSVCFFVWTGHFQINSDDWLIAPRGNTVGDYFLPYGENLSAIPIAVYHAWFSLIGMGTYWPLRVIMIATHLGIATTAYLILRSRIGAAVGLVVAAAILWYPGVYLIPSVFNHWLALIASMVCAWALTREGRTFDILAGAAVLAALCSSGVGAAGAVGAMTYVALSRAPLRRWIAVGIPTALFALWRLTLAHYDQESILFPTLSPGGEVAGATTERDPASTVRYVLDGVINTFQLVASDSRLAATLLALVFVAHCAWRLREGTRAAAQQLAWTAAMLAWWLGLALERGSAALLQGGPGVFRYRLVSLAFVAVALAPTRVSATTLRRATSGPAVAAAIAAAVLLIAANGPATLTRARDLDPLFRTSQQKMIAANLGPEAVADAQPVWLSPWTVLAAGQYRELTERYGAPEGTDPVDADAALIEIGRTRLRPVTSGDGSCRPLAGPLEVAPDVSTWHRYNPITIVTLRAGSTDVSVDLRRFGESWVDIGRIPAGGTVQLRLPDLMSRTPWVVRAPGACTVAA